MSFSPDYNIWLIEEKHLIEHGIGYKFNTITSHFYEVSRHMCEMTRIQKNLKLSLKK